MKKLLAFLFVFSFLFPSVFAAQERLTTASHDVIKVTLDWTHKFVVNVVQNGNQPKSVKTLMDEVGWVSAINGAFFDAYSKEKSSDMIAISNWLKRAVYWDDMWETRALFWFQPDWTPLLVTNSTRSWDNNISNWVNSEFSKIQYGLSMHVLLINWVNVSYNNSEMNNDKKQWGAATKEFICSTQDKSTVYFWRVFNVTFMWLAEYIQRTFNCYDAIQLDAWYSTAIYFEWEKIAWPWRDVMDAIVVVEDRTKYNEELQNAITWMYENWMTKFDNPISFMADWAINREQAAKFFWVLAETIYKKEANKENLCKFSDILSADPTLQENIVQSCELWLFQWHNWIFDPKTNLTNAQALAVLSRIVNGKLDENFQPWYSNYYRSDNLWKYVLANWLRIWSISSAEKEATRWEIAIMIYRTANIE